MVFPRLSPMTRELLNFGVNGGCATATAGGRARLTPTCSSAGVTATDTVPVSYHYISRCFSPARITAGQLREDRILDEAPAYRRPSAADALVRHL
jgi:hypothetical protein